MKKENLILEIKRKFLHLFFGIALVALLAFGFINIFWLFIIFIIALASSLICKRHNLPGINWILINFDRKKDIKTFPAKGLVFYLMGSLIVLVFFPFDIALASILVLAFADSIGHLFGLKFGKIPHPFITKKFVEGWVAGLAAGFLGAFILLPWHEALAASFFAMMVEGLQVKIGRQEVDDNLIIPLASAMAILAVRIISNILF